MAVAVALHVLRSLRSAGLDFALPPRCPGCGAIVDGDHRFCVTCWQSLEFLGSPSCIRCAVPLPHDIGPDATCAACDRDPPIFDRAAAAVAYGEVARTVALRLKYGRRPGVALTMAGQMARLLGDLPPGACVGAVPLHRWRLWKRGYNQALLIARGVAEEAGLDCVPDLIERTRATPTLRGLGTRERRQAVRDAFRVPARHRQALAGRIELLGDDVFTSGATAEACARALKEAGAREVRLLCWARVLREEGAAR
ncbi:MAG: double zinc ribbon domain-containing protein [Sphingomonas oligoaromativorans]